MSSVNIQELIAGLKDANERLTSIRQEFASEPFLLNIYEPSAIELVQRYEHELVSSMEEQSGVKINLESKYHGVDVWLRFEGEKFHDGKGPIGVIGAYLQKLNSACQYAAKLIDETLEQRTNVNTAVFDLVQTATGSLKLGLRHPGAEVTSYQEELFSDDPWEKFKIIAQRNEKTSQALSLLLRAVSASTEQVELDKLKQDLKEDARLLRLFHYTKELAPSSQSPIEKVSFECFKDKDCAERESVVVDKTTRRVINHQTRVLQQGKEYVKCSGIIRMQDIDNKRMVARPLWLKSGVVEEVECRLPVELSVDQIPNFLNKMVTITGFLSRDAARKPSRIDIDTIFSEDEDIDDE